MRETLQKRYSSIANSLENGILSKNAGSMLIRGISISHKRLIPVAMVITPAQAERSPIAMGSKKGARNPASK